MAKTKYSSKNLAGKPPRAPTPPNGGNRSGLKRPSLPLSNKGPPSKKQTVKATTVAEAQAKAAAVVTTAAAGATGQPYIKADPEFGKKANFSKEEDLFICKAWINVTTDPTVGSGQTGKVFWQRVHEQYNKLYEQEAEVVVTAGRSWESVRDRFQKQIQKTTMKFIQYYTQVKSQHPSGWTVDMIVKQAEGVYQELEKKSYKFGHCIETLMAVPKFNPDLEGNEEYDSDNGGGKPAAKTNKVGAMMGGKLDKPEGRTAAKKKKLLDKFELQSAASQAQLDSLEGLAAANKSIAKTMEKTQRSNHLKTMAELYMKMGNMDKAEAVLKEMEEFAMGEAVAVAVANKPPKEIVMADSSDDTSDESGNGAEQDYENLEEEEDNNDNKAEEELEKESHHSSQPSDDSMIAKNNAAV